ncbi:hypothetical protein P153DRAFT_88530 [Dothidotthia symphoricarpi CBS 119687]|uniref:Uncharacterized protein n=1 Tax=Dothidotthia symphoricarpi CBS 119687 TaxID=1392245 RepID=A0A6A6A531_9PLEO|nr:uncharacterized protein P153DRAFT_88530 [Dothidotthia symphoricarpi CBS 119687]KAF2126234.1 hypothetical protein P153DRAFT_88530 [Dothidotthia symphoricarpi CBS 119687]
MLLCTVSFMNEFSYRMQLPEHHHRRALGHVRGHDRVQAHVQVLRLGLERLHDLAHGRGHDDGHERAHPDHAQYLDRDGILNHDRVHNLEAGREPVHVLLHDSELDLAHGHGHAADETWIRDTCSNMSGIPCSDPETKTIRTTPSYIDSTLSVEDQELGQVPLRAHEVVQEPGQAHEHEGDRTHVGEADSDLDQG